MELCTICLTEKNRNSVLNILFVAPRMVKLYYSITIQFIQIALHIFVVLITIKHTLNVINITEPHILHRNNEVSLRKQLASAGLKTSERLPDDFSLTSGRQRRSFELTDVDENRCEVCKRTCYLSMVRGHSDRLS